MKYVFAFIIIMPILFRLYISNLFVDEFATKEGYLKQEVNKVCDKVSITGVLTENEYDEFKTRINGMAVFEDDDITIQKGQYINGSYGNITTYTVGEKLTKGQGFAIRIKSSNVSLFSRIQNMGVSADDSDNIYYTVKSQCRIEYNE